jgi:hypothetical protein
MDGAPSPFPSLDTALAASKAKVFYLRARGGTGLPPGMGAPDRAARAVLPDGRRRGPIPGAFRPCLQDLRDPDGRSRGMACEGNLTLVTSWSQPSGMSWTLLVTRHPADA